MLPVRIAESLRIQRPASLAPIRWRWIVLGALIVLFAVLVSLQWLNSSLGLTVLWPAAGIAAAWVASSTTRERPWTIGAIAVAYQIAELASTLPPVLAAGLGLLHAATAAVLGVLLDSGRSKHLPTESLAAGGRFLLCCGAVSVTYGLIATAMMSLSSPTPPALLWGRFTASQLLGLLVAAPACLALLGRRIERPTNAKLAEILLLAAITAATPFVITAQILPLPAELLVPTFAIPLLLWAAVRSGSALAATLVGILAIATGAAFTATGGVGGNVPPQIRILVVQAYLIVVALSSLVLCGLLQEIRRSAESVARGNERFARVFALVPDPLLISRVNDGVILDANSGLLSLVGRPRNQLIGSTSVEAGLWPDEERREKAIDKLLVHGELLAFRMTIQRGDGSAILVESSARIIDLEGESCLLSVLRDVTRRERMEADLRKAKDAAEAADRAKGEFLAHMSHEIRTPMNGIMGMAELLLDGDIRGQDREIASTILSSSRGLLTVINDILDLSRLDARRLELDKLPFDPRRVVEEVRALLHHGAEAKGIGLELVLPDVLPARVVGDAARLRQVLLNLVGNAVKFTERGSVRLEVEPETADWLFRIVDTGPGIPPADQPKLFTPFYQSGDLSTRRHDGTGLGLAICRRLVDLMGGSIGVDSEVDRGSCFWIRIPLPTA